MLIDTSDDLSDGRLILDTGAEYLTATARLPEIGGGYSDPRHIAYSVRYDVIMPIDLVCTGRDWLPTSSGQKARVHVTFHNGDILETVRGYWHTASEYGDRFLRGRLMCGEGGPYVR